MISREVTVHNSMGLHARPATYFIQKANSYRCTISIEKDERIVNAKSLLGVLSMGVVKDSVINLIFDGSDEEEAMIGLCELIASGCGEVTAE